MVRFAILISFLSVLLLASCKKDVQQVELSVDGRVLRSSNQENVSGANVSISEQALEGGTVSGSYNSLGSTTTGSNGYFSFSFGRKNALEYLLEVDHPNYFGKDVTINPDDLSPAGPFTQNVTLTPRAWLRVSLFNQNPEDQNDQVTYNTITNFSCACCNTEEITLTGTDVDTSFVCQIQGDELVFFQFHVERFSLDSSRVDSVFCPAFDTTHVNILY